MKSDVKLSIIILCWNDLKVIGDCLRSIYATTRLTEFEVIIPDNGSTDGSIEFIRDNYPQVRLIQNGRNLRFAKANNVGIRDSCGEYVLILNPDTLIHEESLDRMVQFADKHPEAGAFACRVLNADGTYQGCIRPLPSIRSEWIAALHLNVLAHLSHWFEPGLYVDWNGESERTIGWMAGCFILIRADLLKSLGGFDEQFFYYHEDMDLCRRVWQSGHSILYTPEVSITHLGGQSTSKRFSPVGFALDAQITRYRYFYKHYGRHGALQARGAVLASLLIRRIGYGILNLMRPTEYSGARNDQLQVLFAWNLQVDPIRLVEQGEEPELGINLPARVIER